MSRVYLFCKDQRPKGVLARVMMWGLLGFASTAIAQNNPEISPRYAERALADYYESISTEALADVIPRDKYKLLIDVQIEDETELKRISSSQSSYSPLPGTSSNNLEFVKTLLMGQLENITQKRNVLVILDPDYEDSLGKDSGVKEVIQETITGKLKLNLASGSDKINIRNVGMSGMKGRAPASTTASSDFDWFALMTWATAALLLIAGTLYFRRKWRSEEPNVSKLEISEKDPEPENKPFLPPLPTFDSSAVNKSEEKEKNPSLLIMPTSPIAEHLIEKVKTLIQQYPKLTSEALQEFLDIHTNKTHRAAYMVELLGFEQSLKLFKGVSQRYWQIIGRHMADNPVSNEDPIDLEEAAKLYRYLVARIIEHKGLETDMGVFTLDGYSAHDLAKAVDNEENELVAQLISGLSDTMAQDVLNILPVARRGAILGLLAGIDRISAESIQHIESLIERKLSDGTHKPVSISNEARIFTSLSSLSPHEEENLFAQMAQTDPDIVKRARAFRLYPEHIFLLREEILRDELRSYPIDSIAQMLKGADPGMRQIIEGLMTEKKAMVVSDMLTSLDDQPNGPEFASARRDFLDLLFGKYSQGGTEFMDNIFKSTAGSEAA